MANENLLNKVIQGDCLDVMKGIEDSSIDLVFISPPYADRRKNSYGGVHHTLYNDWFIDYAKEIKRVLKDDGSFFLNIKPHCEKGERLLYVYELVIRLKKELGFRFTDEFTWTKNGVPGKFKGRFKNAFEPVYHFTLCPDYKFNPYSVGTEMRPESIARAGRKACGESDNGSGFAGMRNPKGFQKKIALPSNHIHIPQKSNQHTLEKAHPAVFPVDLPTFFIKAFSNEGDTVLDCFLGSGTTAVACVNTNRNFIGIEQEQEYCEIANKRIEDALSKKEGIVND